MLMADDIAWMNVPEMLPHVSKAAGWRVSSGQWVSIFETMQLWNLQQDSQGLWRVWRTDNEGEEHVISRGGTPEAAVLRAYLMITTYLPPTYGGNQAPQPSSEKEGS